MMAQPVRQLSVSTSSATTRSPAGSEGKQQRQTPTRRRSVEEKKNALARHRSRRRLRASPLVQRQAIGPIRHHRMVGSHPLRGAANAGELVGAAAGHGSSSSGDSAVLVVGEHKVRVTPDRHNRKLFDLGDVVECLVRTHAPRSGPSDGHQAGKWRSGVVEFDHGNGTFDVVYDDGTKDRQVAARRMRHRVYSF